MDGEYRCPVGAAKPREQQRDPDRTRRGRAQFGTRTVGTGDDREPAAHVLAAKPRAASPCSSSRAGTGPNSDAYPSADSDTASSGTTHAGTTGSGTTSAGTADAGTSSSDATASATSSSEDGHALRQNQVEFGDVSQRDVRSKGRHRGHDASD